MQTPMQFLEQICNAKEKLHKNWSENNVAYENFALNTSNCGIC
jgi:hypothetical protein